MFQFATACLIHQYRRHRNEVVLNNEFFRVDEVQSFFLFFWRALSVIFFHNWLRLRLRRDSTLDELIGLDVIKNGTFVVILPEYLIRCRQNARSGIRTTISIITVHQVEASRQRERLSLGLNTVLLDSRQLLFLLRII